MTNKYLHRSAAVRVLGILLIAAILTAVCTVVPIPASADSSIPDYQVLSFIHWHRVYVQSDLRNGLCMLLWGGSDNAQFVNNGLNYDSSNHCIWAEKSSNYPEIDISLDDFFTLPGEIDNTFLIEMTGRTDSKNDGLKTARFRLPDKGCIEASTPLSVGYADPNDKDFDWGIATGEVDTDYSDETAYGCVQLYHEQSGADVCFGRNNIGSSSVLYTYEDGDYDYPDYIMYIGEKIDFTVFDSFTVSAGTTYELKGNCLLADGCTITVEPGAVLSVSGRFVNNGYIDNYGTLVIGEGATVCTIDAKAAEAGSITCRGSTAKAPNGQPGEGDLVILGGAKVCFPDESCGLILDEGTSCINNGIMIVPDSILLGGGQFVVTERGFLFTGARMHPRQFDLDSIKVINPTESLEAALSIIQLLFSGKWPTYPDGSAFTCPWISTMKVSSRTSHVYFMNKRNYFCIDGSWVSRTQTSEDSKTVYEIKHHYTF